MSERMEERKKGKERRNKVANKENKQRRINQICDMSSLVTALDILLATVISGV